MSDRRRTTGEIRRSLANHRRDLEDDLEMLEVRAEESLNLRNLAARHPVLLSALGAVVGVLVVRRPALAVRSLTRLAQLGAPFLLRSFFKRDGGGASTESSVADPPDE